MERNKAVSLRGVCKDFGEIRAINALDLAVDVGTIHGLLGPNGSGKSTVMKMVVGLLRPDSGKINVYGLDPCTDPLGVKRITGYVPETPRLYEYLTGLEYLGFIADVYGVDPAVQEERIYEFLDAFELEGRENEMISGYSHGMKQKIALTGAMLHRPRLLVLDEPLGGLDPKSARIVKDLLQKLSDEGVTTLYSTHIMEIADALCDRVSVLYHGEKIGEGSPAELKKLAGRTGSTLEEIFLKLTGSDDFEEIVDALVA
jgi:ABC-2 type transport system ATP-binding protein